jgi:hypothetical protein
MGDSSNTSSVPDTKACMDALQAAQKRVRVAFFLAMGASCIVLLIVINLWNSLLVHDKLANRNSPDQSQYLAEYSKKIADQAFYEIQALGIQISCDDIGLLGPAVLLVFSLYSFMTLRASYCHLKHAVSDKAAGNLLLDAVLDIETTLPEDSLFAKWIFRIPRLLQFLPAVVCGAVIVYWVHAHYSYVIQHTPMDDVIGAARPMARFLDWSGVFFGVLVLFANCAAFNVSKEKEQTAVKAKQARQASTANAGSASMAASSSGD